MPTNIDLILNASSQLKLAVTAARAGKKYHAGKHAFGAGGNLSQFMIEYSGETEGGTNDGLKFGTQATRELARITTVAEMPYSTGSEAECYERAAQLIAEADGAPSGNTESQMAGLGPIAAFALQKALEIILRRLFA